MTRSLTFCTIAGLAAFNALAADTARTPNLLIITVDDMSADSIGTFGCKLADTSPHIDRLAARSMRFNYAHVHTGCCMPSRNALWSGRYSHRNKVEGFYQVRNPDYPVLCDLLQQAGYFTGIRGKVSHSTPYSPYKWDINLDTAADGGKPHNKDVASYGVSMKQGIDAARAAGKPFCLLINVSDPHKPFYAEGRQGETIADPHVPSRVFTPEEVPIPGFLFDDPIVRKELAHYYSSVRRADDCVGEVLAALESSGAADKTVIMFLSDHGMPLPFAKTQLYHHSTHTPLIVQWPGVTKAGTVDDEHVVAGVDLLPTLLEIAEAPLPDGLDGRSFTALLRGERQAGRDMVFKEHNENAGRSRDPMRAVQTRQFLYVFNAWSNGVRVMATATNGTPTCRRMKQLARTDAALAARLDLYEHRVVEELYDVEHDPDCQHNLVASPQHAAELDRLRSAMADWMERTDDPLLDVFRHRDDVAAREAFVVAQEEAAAARGPKRRRQQD
jgi:N-sulfoglucosamine sulfohydrolase